jgi:hypothetical protein
VCEDGAAIVVVARGLERFARKAMDDGGTPGGAPGAAPSGVTLVPVVTSGTIAAVKKRLAVGQTHR